MAAFFAFAGDTRDSSFHRRIFGGPDLVESAMDWISCDSPKIY